jgi:Fe-S-cluster containining protein
MATIMSACESCGACCAFFRVDFSIYELQSMGGTVPDELTEEVNGNHARMCGTNAMPRRCDALTGTIGEQVGCSIYESRSTPCREFPEASEGCARARLSYGLAPLNNPFDALFGTTPAIDSWPTTL